MHLVRTVFVGCLALFQRVLGKQLRRGTRGKTTGQCVEFRINGYILLVHVRVGGNEGHVFVELRLERREDKQEDEWKVQTHFTSQGPVAQLDLSNLDCNYCILLWAALELFNTVSYLMTPTTQVQVQVAKGKREEEERNEKNLSGRQLDKESPELSWNKFT